MKHLRRDSTDADQQAELDAYLDIATTENIARGMTPPQARAAARVKLGNTTLIREEVYRMNTIESIENLTRSVKHVFRALRRNPMFAATSLFTLAIGIGANTAVFTVVNAILLKPLSYPNPEQLISVQHTAPGAPGLVSASGDLRLSPSMFFTYSDHNRAFQSIGAWTATTGTITGQGDPEEVRVLAVTHGLLEALAVQPIAGRWLSKDDQDPARQPVGMLGWGYWQRRFGGDPSVIGRTLTIRAVPTRIVGVMPRAFRVVDFEPEVIAPVRFIRAQQIIPGFFLRSIARLRPGTTLEAASAEITRLIPVWLGSWPGPGNVSPKNWERWRITPALRPLRQDVVGSIESGLWVVMGTIGMVLLIACANVANLLLVRAEARQRELSVRAALGAGWGRIVRELLVESTTLGLLGGLLGTILAAALLKVLPRLAPVNLPRLNEIAFDTQTLLFALGASLFAGLLLGLIPVLKYARPQLALRSSDRSSTHNRQKHRAQDGLVVAQVALAMVLLVCSGLMIRTFFALESVDPGFTEPASIQTIRLAFPVQLIAESELVVRTQQQIVEKLAAIPGVTSVGFASTVPSDGLPSNWDSIGVEGQPVVPGQFSPLRRFKSVSPGFFETMGTRLIAGRAYSWADLLDRHPVVIVSENMALEVWGDARAAVGKRIGYPGMWCQVIGVAQDVHDSGVQEPPPAIVYWPTYTTSRIVPDVARNVTFTLRSARTGSEPFLRQIEQAVWSVNSSLSVAAVQSMADLHNQSIARTSFTMVILAVAGGMALLLGIIGIYGVLSYTVAQRRREVGIRMALGAQPGSVRKLFLQHGLVLTGVGVAIGLGIAVAFSRFLSSLLFGVKPFDPTTYAITAGLLILAALMASYLPAHRAARVDPIETLRTE